MPSPAMAASPSYWCYRCSRFVRVWPRDAISCPDCGGGFLEEADSPPPPPPTAPRHRARRASPGDRSPFNPVIVLRGTPDGASPAPAAAATFELYYDDGAGSGLRPLPASMSDFLMGSGFDRLLDQLLQLEVTGLGGPGARRCERSPASKAAMESMPTVEIAASHVSLDSHCAVCTEAFELGAEAREMPCKHIYHKDCILPWLSLRNSCPVCRHELAADQSLDAESDGFNAGGDEGTVGLTIWRLPGGGFAVGRFSGRRQAGERELPVVYTEMDGGFNSGHTPRRISWASSGGRSRERGGMRQAIRNFFSIFRRGSQSASSSSRSSSESGLSSRRNRRSLAVIS